MKIKQMVEIPFFFSIIVSPVSSAFFNLVERAVSIAA